MKHDSKPTWGFALGEHFLVKKKSMHSNKDKNP